MRRSLLLSALFVAGTLLACDEDPIAPPTTGSISLRIIMEPRQPVATGPESAAPATPKRLTIEQSEFMSRKKGVPIRADSTGASYILREVPRAPSAQAADASEPPRSPDAATAIDEATIRILGPTIRTLTGQTPGTTVTVDGLDPGSYTVVLEGLVAGEVDHFGRTQVTVVAGQDRTATISFASFRPVINAPQSPTTLMSFWVSAPVVAAADSYFTEQDIDPAFTNPDTLTLVEPSVWVAVYGQNTYYYRAYSINDWVPLGRPSDVVSVQIVTDLVASGGSSDLAPSLGFGENASTVLSLLNILPEGDEDWFALDACALDTLVVDMLASALDPPSLLDSYLELYDATGTNLIASDDDSGELLDSYLETVLPVDGTYYLRSRGFDYNEIGNYELAVDLRGGPNNNGASCSGALPVSSSSIDAGHDHSCAITATGEAYCWGYNGNGELGNGTHDYSPSPALVSGSLDLQAIHASTGFSCGLTTSGAAYCWGRNEVGQLGTGSYTYSPVPVAVSGGYTFESITVGPGTGLFACGLTSTGTALCWGENVAGQLGDGTRVTRTAPVAVSGGYSFTQLAAGHRHTCGLTGAGAAYCWGLNSYGQLGTGTAGDTSNVPVAVAGGHVFESITAGRFQTCGVTASGTAYCWGENSDGQLGDGSYTSSTVPVAVALVGGFSFVSVKAGRYHTCGLIEGGNAYCWGLNDYAQLGNSSDVSSASPVPVSTLQTFRSVSAGSYHTCAVTDNGDPYCWGLNSNGQVGSSNNTPVVVPAAVSGGLTLQMVESGLFHSCGVASGGAAYCWGVGLNGQTGDGAYENQLTPVGVSGPANFQSVSAGGYHSCGITTGQEAYCWGYNGYGALGNNTLTSSGTAVLVIGSLPFESVSAGFYHTCGVTTGGSVYCWGRNNYGQLGNAASGDNVAPVQVGVTSAQSITSGHYHSCALTSGGEAYCWGRNLDGQLGNGTNIDSNVPVLVPGGPYQELTAGSYHTCGRDAAGVTRCWGYNGYGQFGDGSSSGANTPRLGAGGIVFESLTAGYDQTCGVAAGGVGYCWGYNRYGQGGNGTQSLTDLTPTLISGGLTVQQFTNDGAGHTCALTTGGTPYCWGDNAYGQLGNGTVGSVSTPTLVTGGLVLGAPGFAVAPLASETGSRITVGTGVRR